MSEAGAGTARAAHGALLDALLDALRRAVGPLRVLVADADRAGYEADWRGRYRATALAVVLPGTTAEVAEVVRLCAQAGVAIVPQGGNTGLTGGAVAPDGRAAVILNLSRMNRIREVDAANNSLTAHAPGSSKRSAMPAHGAASGSSKLAGPSRRT